MQKGCYCTVAQSCYLPFIPTCEFIRCRFYFGVKVLPCIETAKDDSFYKQVYIFSAKEWKKMLKI